MGRLSVSQTINAPVDLVFGYVDDYRNTTKYMKDLSAWEPASSQTHGEGSMFKVGMKAGPMTIESTVEITQWKENAVIGFVARKGFKQSGTWSFAPAGDGTKATLDVEYEFPGGIAGRVAGRAAEPIMRGNLERSVKELKAQTEKVAAKTTTAAKPATGRTTRSTTATRKR